MLWQEGELEESHQLLTPAVSKLSTKGIFTLEELATFNLYVTQEALLNGKDFSRSKVKIFRHFEKKYI